MDNSSKCKCCGQKIEEGNVFGEECKITLEIKECEMSIEM